MRDVKDVTLIVNGKAHDMRVEPRRLLLDCLRDDLGMTGPKEGCGVGVCGACSVSVDGRLTSACLEFAVRCDGAHITTIEGLAEDGRLHPVQEAFVEHGGFQCGICTPGMVMSAVALLEQKRAENAPLSDDEIKDWMMGNLCRCTGYYKILESIRQAEQALAEHRQQSNEGAS